MVLGSKAVLVSSLEKVLPQSDPQWEPCRLEAWRGETAAFQIAFRSSGEFASRDDEIFHIRVDSQLPARMFRVGLVPVQVPCYSDSGDGYHMSSPGMMPDVLLPLSVEGACELKSTHSGWNAVWVDVDTRGGGGESSIEVEVRCGSGVLLRQSIFLNVREQALPRSKVRVLQWMHADMVADSLGCPVWSPLHWKAMSNHLDSAGRMGVTGVLTPLWSPPIDTAPGTYRTPTQLLDIFEEPGGLRLGIGRLERWVGLMGRAGISQVEVPHLFTQWGAEHAPQIWTSRDGVVSRRFGWETETSDPDYAGFLGELLPQVRALLDKMVGAQNVFYHVSDEPRVKHLESYMRARNAVVPLLDGAQVIDALSDPEYLGLLENPVVATSHVKEFRQAGVEPEWVYHCVSQHRGLANRFIAQEAIRHRAMGWQMHKAGASGTLHWGFNFYGTQFSTGRVDPAVDTAAGGGFISGDAFMVYPGIDGTVLESIRHRQVRSGFDDMAVAEAASEKLGREAVLSIIDPENVLDYDSGWTGAAEHLARRARLDRALEDS
ncbi:MAG: DUF4091 domain-containing protein [Arachnia sp.]